MAAATLASMSYTTAAATLPWDREEGMRGIAQRSDIDADFEGAEVSDYTRDLIEI